MTLKEELSRINTLFIDTAPVIYYIEAHPQFGPITKEIFDFFQSGKLRGKYLALKALDAIQISTAIDIDADVFLTNDHKLKQIKEIKVLILKDYLNERFNYE